jgi:hypothetical protein
MNKLKKERKLQKYYQFVLSFRDESTFQDIEFLDLEGKPLPDYKTKLTPTQWKKASKYLTRELVPFSGYRYSKKENVPNNYKVTIL